MTIHHLYLMVPKTKVAAMTEWYTKALAPLTYQVFFKVSESQVALGPQGSWPNFWIRGHDGEQTVPTHLCFLAASRSVVDAFYEAAIAAGGTDSGAPGIREHIKVQPYYAAYVRDPEGDNIEVVWMGDK